MKQQAMRIVTQCYNSWCEHEGRLTWKDKFRLFIAKVLCRGKDPVMIWAGEITA